jgi:hypothetical protein
MIGALALAGGSGLSGEGRETIITLADDGVLVDGSAISEDPSSSVYAGADIVYYEEGRGSSYGEGTYKDEHAASEAARHTVITITQPGVYRVSGTLTSGQIAVDLGSSAKKDSGAVVELILDGVDITCTVAPAIIFYNVWESASTTQAGAIVTLADDSENTVNGSHVARVYKEGTTSKLHKYDGAFYSKRSMIVRGEESGTGTLSIKADNEGLCSEMHLTIEGGAIRINSQDDGINANEDGVSVITINGGYLYIDAGNGSEGDGIDSNGYLIINGGTLVSLANGRSGDGGIDADMDITINGGTVVALGSRNDATSLSSEQPYMELSYASVKSAGALIRITDQQGNEIVTFRPGKIYQSLTFSSPELLLDTVYHVYSGGTNTGVEESDGLYLAGGIYSGGTQQSYSGSGSGTMPRPGTMDPFMNMGQAPQQQPEGMPPAPPIDNRPDNRNPWERNAPGQQPNQQRDFGAVGSASPEFIITASQHSFGNVNDYAPTSGKTAVVFRVNDDNMIASGTSPSISFAGVTTLEGEPVSVPETDIQFTITDVPSENYSASCLLSDGEAALKAIIPADAGNYVLTIAIVDSNSQYTGSSQWVFTIE